MDKLFPIITSLIVLLVLSFYYRKYIKTIVDAKERAREKLQFIISLLIIITTILSPYFLSSKNSDPDYIKRNQPYLEPMLVVEEVSYDRIYYHFVIHNNGNLPADSIIFNVWTYSSSSFEDKLDFNRTLAPGSKMVYNPHFYTLNSDMRNPFLIELEIYYISEVNQEKKDFRTTARFILNKNNVTIGEYRYTRFTLSNENRVGPNSNNVNLKTDSALAGTEGSLAFWFNMEDQHQEGISTFFEGYGKEVLLDPAEKQIYYQVKKDNHFLVLRKKLNILEGPNHHVVITWNNEAVEYNLFVDGR